MKLQGRLEENGLSGAGRVESGPIELVWLELDPAELEWLGIDPAELEWLGIDPAELEWLGTITTKTNEPPCLRNTPEIERISFAR